MSFGLTCFLFVAFSFFVAFSQVLVQMLQSDNWVSKSMFGILLLLTANLGYHILHFMYHLL